MDLKAIRCPNCSGNLRLDVTKRAGSCTHCGSEVVIDNIQKARGAGADSIEKLFMMAETEKTAGNYKDSHYYYQKILDLDPKNYKAIYEKAIVAGMLSRFDNNKFNELLKGIELAMVYVPDNEMNAFKARAGTGISEVVAGLFNDLELRAKDNITSFVVTENSFENPRNFNMANRAKISSLRADFHKDIIYALDKASEYNPKTRANNLRMIVNISPYEELQKTIKAKENELKALDPNYICKQEGNHLNSSQFPLHVQLIIGFFILMILILIMLSGCLY